MTNKPKLRNGKPNFRPLKKVRPVTSYSRFNREHNSGLKKVENANRSNLLRSKNGIYFYVKKQRAFTDNSGKYHACVNVVNWKTLLFEEL